MSDQFTPTTTNMVVLVNNIIDGYSRMGGPERALAQEPIQNSKDACQSKHSPVHVEYRLHQRHSHIDDATTYMLTVIDHGTTGLRGPVHYVDDIQRHGNLGEGDNWAAFEGMGLSKDSKDALGSRGQGKAAFLYHSNLPANSSGKERMIILYDTLLSNNEYRLGVRYARPDDRVRTPPFSGEEARRVVKHKYEVNDENNAKDNISIDLNLEPLLKVGTRIIVPYLSKEAVNAIRSGELQKWMQRYWWRAIQTGKLIVTVVDDEYGVSQPITVPSWWEGEPWTDAPGDNIKIYESIPINQDSSLKIKRIVLQYDEAISDPDIESSPSQFWGVQLLRGQQWIETLGSKEDFSDYVPRDKRAGFRGFVEFERLLEHELREAESSQHDRFDRRKLNVKDVMSAIENKVKEFACDQGWNQQEEITTPAPGIERRAIQEFLQFIAPGARKKHAVKKGATISKTQLGPATADRWKCDLRLSFPNPKSARVDWGQSVTNITSLIKLHPAHSLKHAEVSLNLECVANKGSLHILQTESIEILDGQCEVKFDDFEIIRGSAKAGQVQCATPGQWRLIAKVNSAGAEVARASRNIYVHEDPPKSSDPKPYGMSISVENHTVAGQQRINSGNTIGVLIKITNRTKDDQTLKLTASLGDYLLLADKTQILVPGTPEGDIPVRKEAISTRIVINPATPMGPDTPSLYSINEVVPGRIRLSADLSLAQSGEEVAHASRPLDIEVDPVRPQDWPPFDFEVTEKIPSPRWQFIKKSADNWTLQYPENYPLYSALKTSGRRNISHSRLSDPSVFTVEVAAEGLIEWIMDPIDHNDTTRLEQMLENAPLNVNPERWSDYKEELEELAEIRRSEDRLFDEYNKHVRRCVALMLDLFGSQN